MLVMLKIEMICHAASSCLVNVIIGSWCILVLMAFEHLNFL